MIRSPHDVAPQPPRGIASEHAPRRWIPRRVLITHAAAQWTLARTIAERASLLGSEILELKADRLEGLRGADERATYALAKTTLAIVVSPPSHRKLQPIPPKRRLSIPSRARLPGTLSVLLSCGLARRAARDAGIREPARDPRRAA